MHMPPDAGCDAILKPDAGAVLLWSRLQPERWPLPLDLLPPGTALVGGAVRDGLLNRLSATPDLDLVVPNDALGLTRRLARALNGTCVVLDEERDMARLVLGDWTVDLARREGAALRDDLQRRDYRINAIALPLQPRGDLVDPTSGLQDLQRKHLCAIREQNLIDDPLRLLRGLRLMAEQQLSLDERTGQWIAEHRERLPEVSPERILSELKRLIEGAWAADVIPVLKRLDLLEPWRPSEELQPNLPDPSAGPEMSSEEQALAWPLTRLTHLISDDGLKRLKSSRRLQQRVAHLRHWLIHCRHGVDQLQDADRVLLHRDLDSDLPALILHLPTQLQAEWLRRWRDPRDVLFHPRTPVNGQTLQEQLNIAPGPELGRLIDHLRVEYAFGRIVDQADALRSATRWLRKNAACCD